MNNQAPKNWIRKLPTLLTLLVLSGFAVGYWLDLRFFTDGASGFVQVGNVWMRYALLAIPVLLGILGLRTVGPHAIGVLRLRHPVLAGLFVLAGLCGFASGGAYIAAHLQPLSVFWLALGLLMCGYGVWMFLAAAQLLRQNNPSPTKSAFWGLLAALPFCAQTVYRVLAKPASLYRTMPFVRIFAALFAMLWFGMMLRALYIAMVRTRVRWMYLFGLLTFVFCTCLELVQTIYNATQGAMPLAELLESVNMGAFGLVAAGVSLTISGLAVPVPDPDSYELRPKRPVRVAARPVAVAEAPPPVGPVAPRQAPVAERTPPPVPEAPVAQVPYPEEPQHFGTPPAQAAPRPTTEVYTRQTPPAPAANKPLAGKPAPAALPDEQRLTYRAGRRTQVQEEVEEKPKKVWRYKRNTTDYQNY